MGVGRDLKDWNSLTKTTRTANVSRVIASVLKANESQGLRTEPLK